MPVANQPHGQQLPGSPGSDHPKTKVIWNPNANKGRCGKTWPQIKARLEAVLGPIDDAVTTARGAGIGLAKAAFEQGCRRFVVVGGDGTVNEVINGLIVDDRWLAPDLTFAHIPAGTSNAMSRNMNHAGLGPTADKAFAALAGTATRSVDLFRVDSHTADGRPQTRYGFLLATMGAPSVVGLRAAAVPLLKRLGPLAYVLMSVVVALTYRPKDVRVTIDGGEPRTESMWGALICSSPGAGDGILLAPGALIDDGRIDALTIGPLTRLEALGQIIPRLADGSYSLHPKVARQLVREVAIDTREAIPADVDGEPIGFSPLRLRMLEQQMQVAVAA